jgi:hypothetical protein
MDKIAEVVGELAKDRGYTTDGVLSLVTKRGGYMIGEAESLCELGRTCAMFTPLVSDVLALSDEEERWLHDTVLQDGHYMYCMMALAEHRHNRPNQHADQSFTTNT